MASILITTEQRDALCQYILNHLRDLGDVFLAVETKDFGAARRIGQELSDDLRLIEALGWGEAPETDTDIELDLPSADLLRTFTRLRADVEDLQRDEEREEAEAVAEVEKFRHRNALVLEVCDQFLSAVPVKTKGANR
jgi:hypothetical protein